MSEKLFTFASADEPSDVTRIFILRADIVEYKSGLEQRNRVWTYPRFQFDIQRDGRVGEQHRELLAGARLATMRHFFGNPPHR